MSRLELIGLVAAYIEEKVDVQAVEDYGADLGALAEYARGAARKHRREQETREALLDMAEALDLLSKAFFLPRVLE